MGMEPQSTLSGFSVQTNRASCVSIRQKVFCQTKTNLPPLRSGDFPPKSEIQRMKHFVINKKIIKYSIFNHFTYIIS